ncbi:MAG: sigma-70 family RNA polymerase sigma factor [Cyclobacteriaceae bacterium]|nr:sigma-70 family RNA polymerase sigma factor [Cyclobacteriaceae bacterium]
MAHKHVEQAYQTKISNEEEVLILRSKEDAAAFKPLYEKYYKAIFLFILHRTADKELTADMTSQVFLKALLNIGKYNFRGLPFSAWLYRIAINECNDYFRKSKRSRVVILEDDLADFLYEEMFAQDGMEDLKRKLPEILKQLKYEELQLIELRFMENRPFKEVADILGITENYAKVRTYRILEKMKKLFLGHAKH